VELLLFAQFTYNISETETTKVLPAFANYGYHPVAYKTPIPQEINAEQAILKTSELKDLQEQLALDIKWISLRTAAYYNKGRSMEPTLKEGDKVYLLRRNIETKRPSNKLDHKKLGPFKIDKVVGPVNYRLRLPNTMNIHPIFHISLLEPAPPGAPDAPQTEIEPVNPNAEYDVETILDCKYIRGKVKYLIKWIGYSHTENTWEPKGNLNCPEKLEAFHQQYPDLPREQRSKENSSPNRPKKNKQKHPR
jgi:Chromo (CHRromatin Organisation MOdifier) domain